MWNTAIAAVAVAAIAIGVAACQEHAQVGANEVSLGGQEQVLVANASGDVRALAPGFGPSWSPDGRRITYLDMPPSGGSLLRSIPADGSAQPRTIASYVFGASWRPGYEQIAAVVRRAGHTQLVTMRADGSHVVERSWRPCNDRPSWSRDGALAFAARPPLAPCNIGMLAVQRGATTRFVSPVVDGTGDPLWAPDGRVIAYVTRFGELVVVHGDGSGRRVVLHGSGAPRASWAPDSTQLAVTASLSVHDTHPGLYVVGVAGGRPHRIASAPAVAPPAWSPDGTRIAFVSDRGIETIAPDGRDRHLVVPASENAVITDLAWSPGGTRIAFSAFQPPPEG